MTPKEFEQSIYQYERVRECIIAAVRANPDLLGDDRWLLNAISETDINSLTVTRDGRILVDGVTYTTQVQDFETFEFGIDLDTALRFW